MTPQEIIGILQDKLIAADWLRYCGKKEGKRIVLTSEEVKAVMDLDQIKEREATSGTD